MFLTKLKTFATAAVIAVTGMTTAAHVVAAEPLKAGFVYIGPVGDHGWTYAHDEGRKAVEAQSKGGIKTTFVENVPEGPDAERVIRDLAATGHKLIFTPSWWRQASPPAAWGPPNWPGPPSTPAPNPAPCAPAPSTGAASGGWCMPCPNTGCWA